MTSGRWQAISESNFQWEKEALEWLRTQLPDREPWHAWSNFEFIDDEGRVNEVDLLVLSPAGLFLVEIKSRPGVLDGDAHTWTWQTDGKRYTYDNPYILTDRKAKRLASLLKRQSALIKAKVRLPFVQAGVFLSAKNLKCHLAGTARAGVFLSGRPGHSEDDGIVGFLSSGNGRALMHPVDSQQARAVSRAMSEAGVRPSNKHRQISDYRLGALLSEGENFQEWEGQHVSLESVKRRVRVYSVAAATTPEARSSLVRQARREFEVLEGVDHPGILKVKDYKDTELGPALIFDRDTRDVRLDHLLRDKGEKLTVDQRLQLVRDIAETLKYAHGKRLYHRALCPQSILVNEGEGGALRPRIMNWQSAARESGSRQTQHRTTGTQHVTDYVEDQARVYLAPETAQATFASAPALDVFSLGAIAYHIFSGQPPASSSLELHQKLRAGFGLRLSDVLDGCGPRLQELIQLSTDANVDSRYETIKEFLKDLDAVEDELTTPDPESTVDPSIAGANDRLEGGFTVIKRIGRGSSSDVLLVTPDGSTDELVLKVANDFAHNDRLQDEGEILSNLHHQNIVQYLRTLTVSGRTSLLLRRAGARTLDEMLRVDGRLSLDMLQRFGDELIQAINHLDQEGISHRDIKPENIGIGETRTRKYQIVLFDFSLSKTPIENTSAGTHPYLDPFLPQRRRWDSFAERYALAVTLYEMATGTTPRWGDGKTLPSMLDCEVTIDVDRFDPITREAFVAFFVKALRREAKERFDNAEEMLKAWRAIFENRAAESVADVDGFDAIARTATAETTMAELGYTLEAQEALDRMGIHNARGLLAVDRVRYRYLRGVGNRIRKEIGDKAKELARLRPDLLRGRVTLHEVEDDLDGASSINELAAQLLPKRPAGDERPEETALSVYLGIESSLAAGRWPSLGEAAKASSFDRDKLVATLVKARERWLKIPALTELRAEIEFLVLGQGGVVTAHELAMALLATRGCTSQEDDDRLRQATAVLRACCEAESQLSEMRFDVYDHQPFPLVAVKPEWADYAKQVAAAADACAQADPLLPPLRALTALEKIPGPSDSQPLPAARLLRLATSASRAAALSSRQEIYPRDMPAVQALKQSLGALMGLRFIKEHELADRVRGRYPEAEALPPRPRLDQLLQEVEAPFEWKDAGPTERGYFSTAKALGPSAGTTTIFSRQATQTAEANGEAVMLPDAQRLEDRLVRSLQVGGFMALTVEPRLAKRAETELARRFSAQGLSRISFDVLLLESMRKHAKELNVNWSVVLRADVAERSTRDWLNLMALVRKAVPDVIKTITAETRPVLLVNGGLLARYDLMDVIPEISGVAGRPGHVPTLWLMVPMSNGGLPTVDGVAVPLISPTQAERMPVDWVENRHRSGSAHPVAAGH